MKLTLTCKCGSLDFDYKGNNKFVCNECGATESVYGGEIGLQRQFAPEIETIPYLSDADIAKLSDTLYEMTTAMDKVQELWSNTSSIGSNKYPFKEGFDEVAAKVDAWVASFRGELTNLKNHSYIPDVFKEQGVQVEPREEATNKPESGVKDKPKSVLELKPDAYRIYYADPSVFGCKLGIAKQLCCGNCEMCTSRRIKEAEDERHADHRQKLAAVCTGAAALKNGKFSCDIETAKREEDTLKKGCKPGPQRIKGSKPIDDEEDEE